MLPANVVAGDTAIAELRPSTRRGSGALQVSLTKDRAVVRYMSRDDVGEGAYGDRVSAGYTGPAPGIRGQISEECQRRHANGAEFFDVAGPGKPIGDSVRDGDVLIEA